ncbi:LexA family protein [Pyramidobacter sp.]|uniref:LexA family protein n=1 Tax=Pyramidobacter sp. TaxID=1943581 RepID=UPI0025DE82A6|nr:S24 family peptidase [Pyramidobacter sp.]MCI7404794.1 hypothetical protein [Pyramidobacter sp.]MDY3212256.1 S24 family peptidase [Pyramidobacter sp.]
MKRELGTSGLAGGPEFDCDDRFALPRTFVGAVAESVERMPFVVQVEGDSMAKARICGDSYAVVNPAEEILDGDAALVKVKEIVSEH